MSVFRGSISRCLMVFGRYGEVLGGFWYFDRGYHYLSSLELEPVSKSSKGVGSPRTSTIWNTTFRCLDVPWCSLLSYKVGHVTISPQIPWNPGPVPLTRFLPGASTDSHANHLWGPFVGFWTHQEWKYVEHDFLIGKRLMTFDFKIFQSRKWWRNSAGFLLQDLFRDSEMPLSNHQC